MMNMVQAQASGESKSGGSASARVLGKSLDAGRLGKAVEYLVAASCILMSNGELNAATPLVDDEGVDVIFSRRNHTATMAVQIKARTSASKRVAGGSFVAFVRTQTFRPRLDLFMLFVAVDLVRGAIDQAWLIPSLEFKETVTATSKGRLRFSASLKETSKDRWVGYRLRPDELPRQVLRKLKEL